MRQDDMVVNGLSTGCCLVLPQTCQVPIGGEVALSRFADLLIREPRSKV